MKGIILAGGNGTRLSPSTDVVNKHLLSVYDKPMIYYPLTTLMRAGIREIMIVSSAKDLPMFEALLGDGMRFGIHIEYCVQAHPIGIANVFMIDDVEEFIDGKRICLMLGDNIIHGHEIDKYLAAGTRLFQNGSGATIFAYRVRDPFRYGVVQFSKAVKGLPVRIVEKPALFDSPSNYAVVGLYFYGSEVCDMAKALSRSGRGEYEITDLNNAYIKLGECHLIKLGRGIVWLDTGTPTSLLQAANYIQAVQERQGLMIACPEEYAYRKKWIDSEMLAEIACYYPEGNEYGDYLRELVG